MANARAVRATNQKKAVRREAREEKKLHKLKFFDYNLLFIILFMVGFGLLMLYSTSSYTAQAKLGDSFYYVRKQGIICLIGLVIMYFVSRLDYHFWYHLGIPAYLVSFVLCFAVLIPGIGVEYNGSRRWIGIGSYTLQPSEIAKVGIIIFAAYLISRMPKKMNSFKTILTVFALCIPILGLVAYSNLSTAVILAGILFIVMFVASKRYVPFFGVIAIVAAIGVVFIALASYRMERIQAWFHPEDYEAGYQTLQGLYAIGSGGLFGKGLGSSLQKLGSVPEPMNDMIFTIICEELGLMGAICIILLFLLMLWRFMVIANNAPDLFGALIAVGVMAHIAIQVILNIAVVTNSIPNTGVTLPFISYGGTSVLFLLFEMGIVLSVSRGIKLDLD